jgi:hypothetical protein
VAGIEFFSPQFLQPLDLQIFLIVFFIELVEGGAEFALIDKQLFLEIFRNNNFIIFLDPSIAIIFAGIWPSAGAEDVGEAVFGVVDLFKHEGAVVFSEFGVELFGRGGEYVAG